eukprot:268997-Chlamydomonas_euryale.AAC.1
MDCSGSGAQPQALRFTAWAARHLPGHELQSAAGDSHRVRGAAETATGSRFRGLGFRGLGNGPQSSRGSRRAGKCWPHRKLERRGEKGRVGHEGGRRGEG